MSAGPHGGTSSEHPLLVAIIGPTGSGKTALSLALAEKFNGEIVSCDSVAVYRELEIGTAKPNVEERARAPHHLLDIFSPDQYCTAGDYSRFARQAIAEIAARGHMPIVVGGTGLYLRALLEGLFSGPPRSEELRVRLRALERRKGSEHLHRVLRRLDLAAAASIHANDAPKIIRAIEVCLSSRQPMTEMWKQGRNPLAGFRIVRLGVNPDRNALYERINQRAATMIEGGMVEETRRIAERYGYDVGPLNSTGYKQVVQFLCGKIDHNRMVAAVQQAHRNYAKRQMTWFRGEPGVHGLSGFGDDPEVQRQAIELVRAHVKPQPQTQNADPSLRSG
jgi:tRNA dimethylallyltransferase